MKTIGIGVAGCGAIARLRHIPEYMENTAAKLVGVFDAVPARSRELAEQYKVRAYETFEEMLADPEIEAVSICTANRFHAEMTIAALKAGKHVLCEKPMATSVEDAEAMIQTARDNGRILMVGHNQRLNPMHIRAKQLLRSGVIGRPLTFRTEFMHKGPETWSVDRSRSTWFFDRKSALLGAMCDLGIHKIDLLRWLLDDDFAEVCAMLETCDKRDAQGNLIPLDDNGMCVLKTRRGIVGTLCASWTCYAGEENATVIYCTEGVMRINDDPRYGIVLRRMDGDKICVETGEMQTNDHQTKSGVIDMFVDCAANGREPELSGEEGLAALKVVLACARASEEKRTVSV